MPEIEQPHGGQRPAVRHPSHPSQPGQPSEPVPAGPPHPPGPRPPLDPEQLRQFEQFQQFQQFQELMRQHGKDITPLLPPARKPLWKRVLGSKLVRRLIVLALVLAALAWAYDYYFGNDDENLPASMTGGGTNKTTVLHEKTPKRTVRQVYSHIAQNDAQGQNQYEFVCGQFENGAEVQFARNFGVATCKDAVAKLFGEIDKSQPGWRNTYAEPFTGAELGEEPVGDTATVDTCAIDLEPRLGVFTLRRIEHDQWVINGHLSC